MRLSHPADFWRLERAGKLPKGMPPFPHRVYKNSWKGYPIFLGFMGHAPKQFLNFNEARDLFSKLNISSAQYIHLPRDKRPAGLPSNPQKTYKQDWKGWAHFRGGKEVRRLYRKRSKFVLPFEQARKIARSLNLRSIADYNRRHIKGQLPEGMPSDPFFVYRESWNGEIDFYGL